MFFDLKTKTYFTDKSWIILKQMKFEGSFILGNGSGYKCYLNESTYYNCRLNTQQMAYKRGASENKSFEKMLQFRNEQFDPSAVYIQKGKLVIPTSFNKDGFRQLTKAQQAQYHRQMEKLNWRTKPQKQLNQGQNCANQAAIYVGKESRYPIQHLKKHLAKNQQAPLRKTKIQQDRLLKHTLQSNRHNQIYQQINKPFKQSLNQSQFENSLQLKREDSLLLLKIGSKASDKFIDSRQYNDMRQSDEQQKRKIIKQQADLSQLKQFEQFLRTISNKIDRLQDSVTTKFTIIETFMHSCQKNNTQKQTTKFQKEKDLDELSKLNHQLKSDLQKANVNKSLAEQAIQKLHDKLKFTQMQQRSKESQNKQLESKLKELQLKMKQFMSEKQAVIAKQQPQISVNKQNFMISSNILNLNYFVEGKKFVKHSIQSFQSKIIKEVQLVYQKDSFNSNFGAYLENRLFPLLLLIETDQNVVFGAFTEGYETAKNKHLLVKSQQKQKMKGFLFNATKQTTFVNNKKTSINVAQYIDSILMFGNNQVYIKNNNLENVIVHAGNMIGEQYYNVKYKKQLTDSQDIEIKIKRMQIHRVHFKEI